MLIDLKAIIPIGIKKYYWRYLKRKQREAKKRIKFNNKTTKETFTYIYNTNYWNGHESVSGGGSDPWHTELVVKSINQLIKELKIETIIDVPCGDFTWMKNVDLNNCKYVGCDIVEDLIIKNIEKYGDNNELEFKVIDLINDQLSNADLIINRDCLVHLSFSDIYLALKNIKNSGCKYLLTTSFPMEKENKDITTGEWRKLNLEIQPFNFPPPNKVFNEGLTIKGSEDKSLALWLIGEIELPLTPYNG